MTQWSSADNGLYIGVDLSSSDSTPTVGQTITITCKWYIKSGSRWSDSETLNWSFAGNSGAYNFTNSVDGSTQLVLTKTYSFTATTSSKTVSGSGYISGAYNGAAPSVSDTITSPGANGAPDAPAQAAVSAITSTGGQMNWSAASTNGSAVTGYQAQWSSVSDFSSFANDSSLSSSARSRVMTGLTPNKTYYCRVRANSSAGYGPWSSTRSFTTSVSAPGSPTNVQLTDTSTPSAYQLQLSWNAGATNGASGINFDTLVSKYTNGSVPYATTTTAALSTAGAITSITVAAIPRALVSGDSITLQDTARGNWQVFIVGAAGAASGATSIPVVSQTPNFAYPSGSNVLFGTCFSYDTSSPSPNMTSGIYASTLYYGWVRVASTSPSSVGSWVTAAATVTTGASGGTGDLVDRVNAAVQQIGNDIATLNGKRRSGELTITTSANAVVSSTVTFSPPFPSGTTPAIVVQPISGTPQNMSAGPSGRGSTGFTMNVFRTTSASTTVAWVAYIETQ